MTIKLNDQHHEVAEGISLATLLENLGINPKGIAVAINYEVVQKNKWAETILSDNLELILIQAVQGG